MLARRTLLRLLGTAGLAGAPALRPVAAAGLGEGGPPSGPALQLLSPGPTGVATYNQLLGPQPFTARIADEAMRVRAERVRFTGIAPGMRNVAIVIAGAWTMAVPDAEGRFAAMVDLTGAARGPLVVDVYAWDAPPDVHTFKVALNLRVHLFVQDGRDASPPVERPPGHPAHGRSLIWAEPFTALSRERWFLGPKPDGQEFGAALFAPEPVGDVYGVFDGFLRLRARHCPDLQDPRGWGRTWVSGQLSSAFPDGLASGAFRTGHFEARMMLPAGPGAWSSFWLLDQASIRAGEEAGAVEIDVFEGYGHATTSYVATTHDWPPPAAKGTGYRRQQRNVTGLPDAALGFHDYGVTVTQDEIVFTFDGTETMRTGLFRRERVSPFFMLLTLAMSHDWPIVVPPSGYYDLWVDHVRVYS
ncbi:glycoside hydrolase family 16 protein [Methylobacterium sp. JK268]